MTRNRRQIKLIALPMQGNNYYYGVSGRVDCLLNCVQLGVKFNIPHRPSIGGGWHVEI